MRTAATGAGGGRLVRVLAGAAATLLAALMPLSPRSAAAWPGLSVPPALPGSSLGYLAPRGHLSIAADTLGRALLKPDLYPPLERIDYGLRDGEVRRVVRYRDVTLVPGMVYSPDEWKALVLARSNAAILRGSALEAIDRGRKASGGSLTKFEIPVKFPKAIGGIIGQGVNINVSGREAISFSGESNIPINARENEIGGPRLFPDLDMRQQLQINLDGQIGEKINVQVQHDSESQTPLSNRIKLRYTGGEDEILQKVEIGNTALTLPTNNQYVSFSGRQQGLFGAKMEGRAGKLDFTAIVSKQEGRTDRETFVGQSSEQTIFIPDYGYEKNRVFVITGSGPDPGPDDYRPVTRVEVYLDDRNGSNNLEAGVIAARAYLDGNPSRPDSATAAGSFEQLREAEDYAVNLNLGVLIMNRPIADEQVLAVFYYLALDTDGNGVADDSIAVGFKPPIPAPVGPDTTILKLIKPVNPSPGIDDNTDQGAVLRETWALQLRNVYDLHASGIQPDGFKLRVLKRLPGQADTDVQGGTPLLRVLGLDNQGLTQGSNPDDRVDLQYPNCNANLPWRDLVLVDYSTGIMYMPGQRPFDPLSGQDVLDCNENVTLEDRNESIYKKRYAELKTTDQKYVFEVSYRSTGSSTLSLGRTNILEGSEVVRMGDKVLQRGVDYRITYEIGLIEFLSDEAKSPEARISVDFEYAPFLAQQQKSLLGMAGTYKFSPNAEMSSILLFESNKTPYRRPRVGQEPSRAMVGGLAGQWRASPGFLTDWADRLPLVQADRGSNLAFSGEIAGNLPNPNTKNNIYVDDMEGTEENSNLGNGRRQWTYASVPRDANNELLAFRDHFRTIEWYNPKNAAQRSDLNPDLTEDEGRSFITVLEVALKDGSAADSAGLGAWGGVMRSISRTGVDYSRRKFLEVWINDFDLREGTLHVDLGTLSEDATWQRDVAPNGRLDSEDKNQDGRLDDSGDDGPLDEDSGLDGTFNPDEPCLAPPCDGADPTGDTFDYDPDENENDYTRINGTEDNGYLDTEDLDGDFSLNTTESFFRYTIDLRTVFAGGTEVAALGSQTQGKSWRLYRIPLTGGEAPFRNPKFESDIKTVRVWFSDVNRRAARFQIASIEVVGNRWLEGPLLSGVQTDSTAAPVPGYGLQADSTADGGTFAVRTIDNKSGESYTSPPIDLRETNDVLEREQSLVLDFDRLAPSHSGYALKDLFQEEDYSRYSVLNFWYQGRETDGGEPWLFLRFGFDSLNFYEYRVPVVADRFWHEVRLDLAELTRVKLKPVPDDSLDLYVPLPGRRQPYPYYFQQLSDGSEVAAFGSPTVTRVGAILFGVTNRSGDARSSGEVWVNELRLTDVLKSPGVASRLSGAVDFSDLASLSGSWSRTDDEFHSLGGTRTGRAATDLRLGGGLSLHKFVEPLGITMPFTWSWAHNKQLPELKTGSDVVLLDREPERSEGQDLAGNLAISRTKKSRNPLIYHTIDAMSLSLSGATRNAFTPTKVDTSDMWRMGVNYNFHPRTPKELRVWRSLRVAYFPTNIGFTASDDNSNAVSTDTRVLANARTAADSARATREVENNRSASTLSFDAVPITTQGVTTTYTQARTRDHTRGDETFIKGVNWGLLVAMNETSTLKYTPTLPKYLTFLSPNASYDTRYSEVLPYELERAGSDDRPRNVQEENRSTVNLTLSPNKMFGPGGAPGDTTKGRLGSAVGSVGGLLRRIQEVRTTASVTRGSTYDRVADRPDLAYRFGIAEAPSDQIRDKGEAGRAERFTQRRDFSGRASSGVQVLPGVSLTGEYSYSRSRQEQSNNRQARESVTWPRLTLNWSNLERFKMIEKAVESANLTVAYQVTGEKQGPSIDTFDRSTTRSEWAPLFGITSTLENGLNTNLTANKSTSRSESRLGGGTDTEGSQSSVRLGFEYRIQTKRKVSMPLLGKGEATAFTSELGLALDLNYQTDEDRILGRGGIPDNVQSHNRSWNFVPRANYSFSKNVTGSLEARYGQVNNKKNENLSRRTVGVSVSATLRF